MAKAIRASSERMPNASRVMSRILVLTDLTVGHAVFGRPSPDSKAPASSTRRLHSSVLARRVGATAHRPIPCTTRRDLQGPAAGLHGRLHRRRVAAGLTPSAGPCFRHGEIVSGRDSSGRSCDDRARWTQFQHSRIPPGWLACWLTGLVLLVDTVGSPALRRSRTTEAVGRT